MKSTLSLVSASALVAGAAALTGPECCSQLSDLLPGLVFLPDTDGYTASINRRWSNTSILPAACAFLPGSAEDISAAFGVIVPGQCLFSIVAGGHQPFPGIDGIDGGISIDLQKLNGFALSPDKSFVTLGMGQNWGSVYGQLVGSGVGVPGALESGPGVGGLVCGGGLAAASPLVGWTVDQARRLTVVLTSGQIVNATADENADLFRAQKGGGSSFGIVTEVDLNTFPLDDLWGGLLVYLRDGPVVNGTAMVDAVSQAAVDTLAALNNDSSSIAYFGQLYAANGGTRSVLAAVGNMDDVENPPAVQPLLEMPNLVQQTTDHQSLADFAALFTTLQPDGARQVFANINVKANTQALTDIWLAGEEIFDSVDDDLKQDLDWIILNGLIPSVQQTHAAASGGNILGLEGSEDMILVWLTARYHDPAFDDTMGQLRDQWVETVTGIAQDHDALSPFVYLNIAGPTQSPYCSYGSDMVALLTAAAQKYDPDGVMQTLYPGGHKLSKANCPSTEV